MPRVQVYLPEDLHRELKQHGLAASELLQEAVRAELRRRELASATDSYLRELVDEVGEPTEDDVEYARRFVAELAGGLPSEPERHAG